MELLSSKAGKAAGECAESLHPPYLHGGESGGVLVNNSGLCEGEGLLICSFC